MPNKNLDTAMTDAEREKVQQVAKLCGLSEQDAIDCLAKGGLARRVKKRTGRNPARIYSMKKK